MDNNSLEPFYGTCQHGISLNNNERKISISNNIIKSNTILTPQNISGANTTTLTPQN